MDFRRVEQPRGRVPGAHQQAYFRTAEDDALRAPGRQAADDRRERPPGGLGDRPETQLIEDDAIDERAPIFFGDQHGDAPFHELARVKILFHRVARAEQPDRGHSGGLQLVGGQFRDVQQRQGRRRLHRVRHLVHGVRTDEHAIGSGAFQAASGLRQQFAAAFPVPCPLAGLNLMEIHAVQDALGGMEPAEPLLHQPIDDLVVCNRAFPAHAADKANGLHQHGSQCGRPRRLFPKSNITPYPGVP